MGSCRLSNNIISTKLRLDCICRTRENRSTHSYNVWVRSTNRCGYFNENKTNYYERYNESYTRTTPTPWPQQQTTQTGSQYKIKAIITNTTHQEYHRTTKIHQTQAVFLQHHKVESTKQNNNKISNKQHTHDQHIVSVI